MHRHLVWATALAALLGCTRDLSLPPLPSPGTVNGRVVYAVAGQTLPVAAAGAKVSLVGTSLAASADSDGRFLLSGIAQSEGQLLFQVDSRGSGVFDRQRVINLSEIGAGFGRQVGLGDVTVGQNAQMHGRVILGDRVGQPGGQGGTSVFVPAAPYTATTNDDGSWTLGNLPEGNVALSMFHALYEPAALDQISLRSGEDFGVKDIVLAPAPGSQQTGTLAGSVAFVPSLSSAAGTSLVATPSAGPSVGVQAATDGTFIIENLNAGLYAVTATHAGYADATLFNVLVQSGLKNVLPTIVLEVGAGDAGVLVNDGGIVIGPNDIVASAGAPGAVVENGSYTLDGTGSRDGQGRPLLYQWAQTAGAPVALSINNSVLAARPTFTAPATPQNLQFTLTVSNGAGGTAIASTVVTVALPPVARVSPALLTLHAGETGTLDASASSDPTGAALTYSWTVVSGPVTLVATGPTAKVTAQSASGAATVRLVVSNGFVPSAPLDVGVLTGAPSAVSVSAGPDQLASTNAVVFLTATAQSSDPNDSFAYQWIQTDGGAVQLGQAQTATASFVTPAQPAQLTFQVTATASGGGNATASVGVQVVNTAGPVTVSTDPAFNGGTGSPLYARAVFDKALNPATVTPATLSIVDGTGAPVPSDVQYDPATYAVTVSPKSPLTVGAAYTFKIGAVTDTRGAPHVATSVSYSAANAAWSLWASGVLPYATPYPPNPGLAVKGTEVTVFGSYNNGSYAAYAWLGRPDAGGVLEETPLVFASGNGSPPVGRKGVVVSGSVWGFDFVDGLLEQEGTGWLPQAIAPLSIQTDGSSLVGVSENYGLSFYTYDPGCAGSWCREEADPEGGTYDTAHMSVAGENGIFAAAGSRSGGGATVLQVFQRSDAGVWTVLDGGYALGAMDSSAAPIPSRLTYASGEPFVLYSTQTGVSQIRGASWSSATQSWTYYPSAGGGSGSSFDVVARGNTVYIASVLAGSLQVRQLDLSSPSPTPVILPGPTGPSLSTCTAGHPELYATADSVWVTWHEMCVTNFWQVYLARWQ